MLGLKSLFKERPAAAAGKALYARVVEQARTPAFYAELGVPDTVMGRFELYTLHAILLVLRLKGRGPAAAEAVQALFDAYLAGLDIALREIGVGDLSMGKKMKKLGRAFYGRTGSWERALSGAEDIDALVARTLHEGIEGADPSPLSRYARSAAAALAEQSDTAFLEGNVAWPEVTG